MLPKVVIFDLGKVLVDFDYTIAARKIAAQCPEGLAAVARLLDHSPVFPRYETGLLTREQFCTEVRGIIGYTGPMEQFATDFADIFTEIPEMVAAHAALRLAGFRTYILSNTNDLAEAHIRRRFRFFADFDGYILSYEVKAMKPDSRIYEVAEERSGCRGAEILYLDDRAENVEAGIARGWQGIVHSSPEQTLPAMRALGLPV